MEDNVIPLRKIEQELLQDEGVAAAAAEHLASCDVDSEDCAVCEISSAIRTLAAWSDDLVHADSAAADCECGAFSAEEFVRATVSQFGAGMHLIAFTAKAAKTLALINEVAAAYVFLAETEMDED